MVKKEKKLPLIKYNKIPNVLLLGNGVNKSFKSPSWSELIESITTGEYDDKIKCIEKMPYPLQPVVLSSDGMDDVCTVVSEKMLSIEPEDEQKSILSSFVNLGFDAILTTNYSYEIEKSISDDFCCNIGKPCKWRYRTIDGNKNEEQFGIYKYIEINIDSSTSRIWHIHGEAARSKSIVLDHYRYGKLLSVMQQYSSKVLSRYKGCNKNASDFQPYSWLDYFLIGNVYICAFGMDLSEYDIWWLLNCKKRNFKDFGNVYYFEPNITTDKKKFNKMALAKSYGVELVDEGFDGNYKHFYLENVEQIKRLTDTDIFYSEKCRSFE